MPTDNRNEDAATHITSLITGNQEISIDKKHVTQEQLQHELDYFRAQQILKSMLDNGLITLSEFNKITSLNRQSFSPIFAQIMPNNR
ncbi:MAG TPA: SHOCT domain-containing protein [Ruminiclostridium sp.]